MRPIFEVAAREPQRLVYTDGEEERVLRAVQVVLEEGLARPILVGRPEVIEARISASGLRLRPGTDFELTNPDSDPRFNEYAAFYLERMGRRGVGPQAAREAVRTRRTVIGAIMLARGEATRCWPARSAGSRRPCATSWTCWG
jgi:malate dehydrogenase (oxaloacetate-decarboxylating)(NADP+)